MKTFRIFVAAIASASLSQAEPPGPATPAVPAIPATPAVQPAPAIPLTMNAPVTPATPPKQMEVDVPAVRAKYPNLLKIRHFSTIDAVIIGSKARIGVKDNELQEFATYCFGQLFKGYDLKPLPTGVSPADANEFGTLNLTINTYAIGVSVELRLGTVGSENTWTTNELRVSSNNMTKDTRLLKTSIATMLAKGAYTLRKAQGR